MELKISRPCSPKKQQNTTDELSSINYEIYKKQNNNNNNNINHNYYLSKQNNYDGLSFNRYENLAVST